MHTVQNCLPAKMVLGDQGLAKALGKPLSEILLDKYRHGRRHLPLTIYRLGRTTVYDAVEVEALKRAQSQEGRNHV